ncbi:hypothetical protein TNCV_941741 [Trichonephila clavipes]|nr:hypothetical protein TNCV_941741 [Trichonephila clavipes]
MLQQTSSNRSCRHLLSCKRPQFLTRGSLCGSMIYLIHEGNMPVFSTAGGLSDRARSVQEEAKLLTEFLKRKPNLKRNTDSREGEEKQDAEPRLMQFSDIFSINYNQGFLFPTSLTTHILCLFFENDDAEN